MTIIVKFAPNIHNDYSYGVIESNNQFIARLRYEGLKYRGLISKELEDIKFQGNFEKDAMGAYFKTEALAREYASILYSSILESKKLDKQHKLERKAKEKVLGSSKLLWIIPETWYSKVRIFLNF